MNANWIINMLLRRFLGRALRFGVNAGLRRLSGGKDTPANSPAVKRSRQARDAERARIRGLRLARRGMRGPKL